MGSLGGTAQRFPGRLAAALWLCACACDAGPGPSPDDRYALRRFPIDPEWKRESQVPRRPERPGMAIWEVSIYPPGSEPTPEQERAARELVEASHRAVLARGWQDHAKALADGFYLMPNDRRHFQKDEYLLDDRVLDPEHPEFLMYEPSPDGMTLTGLMFLMPHGQRGPQLGGPLTVWHYHLWSRKRCYRDGIVPLGTARRYGLGCREGEGSFRSPEMLHVWLIDRPGGPFATPMYVEPETLPGLLAKRLEERGY